MSNTPLPICRQCGWAVVPAFAKDHLVGGRGDDGCYPQAGAAVDRLMAKLAFLPSQKTGYGNRAVAFDLGQGRTLVLKARRDDIDTDFEVEHIFGFNHVSSAEIDKIVAAITSAGAPVEIPR